MTPFTNAQLATVKTVVVHDNCPDGMASAIFVKDAFESDAQDVEILFIQHNTPEHKAFTPRPGVMFVDFVPYIEKEEVEENGKKVRRITEAGRAVLQAWVDAGALVLDHHSTAKDIVVAFGDNARFGDEKANPGVCGATLAYTCVWARLEETEEYVIGSAPVRAFARRAGIRDTWQRQSPEWEDACLQAEVLSFFPREHWLSLSLNELMVRWEKEFEPVGRVLLEKQERAVKKISESCYRFTTTRGTRVVCFDSLKTSDVADALDNTDLVVGFHYLSEPGPEGPVLKLICSTRTREDYPCGALASYYGGGGHTKAAGFNRLLLPTDPQPYFHVAELVEAFEADRNLSIR